MCALAEAAAKGWLKKHLRYVEPQRHLVFQNELNPSSPELTGPFDRELIGANDTSATVG